MNVLSTANLPGSLFNEKLDPLLASYVSVWPKSNESENFVPNLANKVAPASNKNLRYLG